MRLLVFQDKKNFGLNSVTVPPEKENTITSTKEWAQKFVAPEFQFNFLGELHIPQITIEQGEDNFEVLKDEWTKNFISLIVNKHPEMLFPEEDTEWEF